MSDMKPQGRAARSRIPPDVQAQMISILQDAAGRIAHLDGWDAGAHLPALSRVTLRDVLHHGVQGAGEGPVALQELLFPDEEAPLLALARDDPECADGCPELRGEFVPVERIGDGTFSAVYRAVSRRPHGPRQVAIKRVRPTCRPDRVLNEVRFIGRIGGAGNVVSLLGGMRAYDRVSIVLPYFPHDQFRAYFRTLSMGQVQLYMRRLLESLRTVHAHRIIHRDIKPSNCLFRASDGAFMLVDFGLAQDADDNTQIAAMREGDAAAGGAHVLAPRKRMRMRAGGASVRSADDDIDAVLRDKRYLSRATHVRKNDHRPTMDAPRAGTRGFRAPEVLLRSWKQGVAIDVWSAGVILLCLLSQKHPFFDARDDESSLVELASVFGSAALVRQAHRLSRRLVLPVHEEGVRLRDLCAKMNGRTDAPASAFALLERLLDLDATTRVSAAAALEHAFFAEDFGE